MAEAVFTSDDLSVPYTSATALTAGQVVVVGGRCYIAAHGSAANSPGLLYARGRATFAKGTTAAAISIGDSTYWDDTSNVVTTSTSGNTLLGIAWEAAGTAAGTISCRFGLS